MCFWCRAESCIANSNDQKQKNCYPISLLLLESNAIGKRVTEKLYKSNGSTFCLMEKRTKNEGD